MWAKDMNKLIPSKRPPRKVHVCLSSSYDFNRYQRLYMLCRLIPGNSL